MCVWWRIWREDVACVVHGDDGGLSDGDCSDVRFLEL